EQRDDVREAVDIEPDELLLPPHLAVVAGEPTWALTRAEAILDDPREVPRLQPLGPAPSQTARRHAAIPSGVARSNVSSSSTARRDPATSCTRTSAAPCSKHQTVVARVASSRRAISSAPRIRARNDL